MNENLKDDELLRSYLLGDLPEEEVNRLEERLLADDELFDLAEAIEADLLEAAHLGELTPAERKRVLRRLASSPQGRERLAMAQALNTVVVQVPAPAVVVPIRRVQRRHTAQWMALAASLLLMTGLGWFAMEFGKEASSASSKLVGFAVEYEKQATDASSKMAKDTSKPTAPEATPPEPERAAKEIPKSTSDQVVQQKNQQLRAPVLPEPIKSAVLQFAVLSGNRSNGKTVTLDLQGAPVAEIQIDTRDLEGGPPFHVTVRDLAQGTTVFEEDVSPQPIDWENEQVSALVIKISAERLSAGRYEVSVTSELGPTPQTEEFEVVREGTDG